MRLVMSLTDSLGVSGFVSDVGELVIGLFFAPESVKKELLEKKMSESKKYNVLDGTITRGQINMSFCFVDKERKVDSLYKGTQMLMINHSCSFKNATLTKQYFLIPKREDTMTEAGVLAELQSQFFNKALKKLPLPISKDWEQYIWEEISPYFTELDIVGNLPYVKVFKMTLPNVQKLEALVEIAHKSFEFQERWKRVPRIKAVLGTSDIQHFNFKEWQTFLNRIGMETFNAHSYNHQLALVQSFEVLGDNQYVIDYFSLWHATAIKKVGIMLRLEKDKNKKIVIRNLFLRLFELFKDNSGYIHPAINNFQKLASEHEENIKLGNLEPIKKALDQIQYEEVETGAEELARVCGLAKVSDSEYKKFETEYLLYLDSCLTSARAYPTIGNKINEKIGWEILDMSVPRAWTVGIETHCCMHPDSVGGVCLTYAAQNPETSGIIRITENGKTIAQSFFWLSKFDINMKRTFVLDNIEVLGSGIRSTVIDAYKDLAEHLTQYANLFGIKAITIGSGYSDVTLSEIARKIDSNNEYYAQIPETLRYSDARTQYLFKEF
jgi:hypothetical protein